jgi:hypothetical protein
MRHLERVVDAREDRVALGAVADVDERDELGRTSARMPMPPTM